jgi:hypothetical protein
MPHLISAAASSRLGCRRWKPHGYPAAFTDDRIDIDSAARRMHALAQLSETELISGKRFPEMGIETDAFIDDGNFNGDRGHIDFHLGALPLRVLAGVHEQLANTPIDQA